MQLAAIGLVGSYLVAVPLGLVNSDHRLNAQEIVLGLVIILGVAFSTQSSYSLKKVGLGAGGLTAELERITIRQSELESEIHALQVAVSGVVTKYELEHLRGLASDGPAIVRFGEIFVGELTRLDAIGFIGPVGVRGLNAIREDQGSGLDDFDLKGYVEITKEGLDYLAVRSRLTAETVSRQAERPPEK